MILFGTLTLISLFQLIKPPAPTREGGSLGFAFLSVPLYAYMAISTGFCLYLPDGLSNGARDLLGATG